MGSGASGKSPEGEGDAERRHDARGQGRRVDDPHRVVALQHRQRPLEDLLSHPVLRLARVGTEVRGHDDVVALQQRVVRAGRLQHEDVEPRAEEPTGLEGREERVLLDDAAARGVDDHGADRQGRELLVTEHAAGLVREGRVDGQEVRTREHGAKVVEQLDLQLVGATPVDVRVVRRHLHAEPLRLARHERADTTEANHPEPRRLDLPAQVSAVPLPAPQELVGARHASGRREHEGDGELGGGYVVGVRCVDDQDVAPTGGVEVDVVDPHPASPDDLEALPCLKQLLVDLRATASDDGVVIADHPQELGPADAGAVVQGHSGIGEHPELDVIGDEDAQHIARLYYVRRSMTGTTGITRVATPSGGRARWSPPSAVRPASSDRGVSG